MADRTSHHYRKRTARLRRTAAPVCWICHEPIDLTLDYRDPMSWTADHVDPIATGGDLMGELRPAHRSCNTRRGTATRTTVPITSNNW